MGELTQAEHDEAVSVGKMLFARAKFRQFGEGHGDSRPNEARHIIGAIAEQAYAKEAGTPWPNDHNEFGKGHGDFPLKQIRATVYHGGHLIVFDDENVDHEGESIDFVLVIVSRESLQYRIAGEISGAQARKIGRLPESWEAKNEGSKPQKWIHQRFLKPWRLCQPQG